MRPEIRDLWRRLDPLDQHAIIFGTMRFVASHALRLMDPKELSWRRDVTRCEAGAAYLESSNGYGGWLRNRENILFSRTNPHYDEFHRHAFEKVDRTKTRGGCSSWATRDVEKKLYGGGISVNNNVFQGYLAFSGFSEHWDEAICVVTLMLLGLIRPKEIIEIKAASDNPYISRLYMAIGVNLYPMIA